MIKFKVQSKQCSTCIYKKNSVLDLKKLEEEIKDKYGFFNSFRACHHGTDDVCCRGFWNKHKDDFQAGQIANRLGLVEFVTMDTMK